MQALFVKNLYKYTAADNKYLLLIIDWFFHKNSLSHESKTCRHDNDHNVTSLHRRNIELSIGITVNHKCLQYPVSFPCGL